MYLSLTLRTESIHGCRQLQFSAFHFIITGSLVFIMTLTLNFLFLKNYYTWFDVIASKSCQVAFEIALRIYRECFNIISWTCQICFFVDNL